MRQKPEARGESAEKTVRDIRRATRGPPTSKPISVRRRGKVCPRVLALHVRLPLTDRKEKIIC